MSLNPIPDGGVMTRQRKRRALLGRLGTALTVQQRTARAGYLGARVRAANAARPGQPPAKVPHYEPLTRRERRILALGMLKRNRWMDREVLLGSYGKAAA